MPVFKKPRRTLHSVLREIVDRTNSDTGRIRILEQTDDTFLDRINALEQEALELKKQLIGLQGEMEGKLEEKDKRIARLEMVIKEMALELKKFATRSDVLEIRSLIDIYNPIKSNFITKEEARRILGKK